MTERPDLSLDNPSPEEAVAMKLWEALPADVPIFIRVPDHEA